MLCSKMDPSSLPPVSLSVPPPLPPSFHPLLKQSFIFRQRAERSTQLFCLSSLQSSLHFQQLLLAPSPSAAESSQDSENLTQPFPGRVDGNQHPARRPPAGGRVFPSVCLPAQRRRRGKPPLQSLAAQMADVSTSSSCTRCRMSSVGSTRQRTKDQRQRNENDSESSDHSDTETYGRWRRAGPSRTDVPAVK